MPLPVGVYRADHVGSLLRPKEIIAAREKLTGNDTSSLRPLEDQYVAEVVKEEVSNGLRSITDGEFRRAYFHLDFLQHLDGVEVEGNIASTSAGKDDMRPPRLVVPGKIQHSKPIQLEDFKFLESQIKQNGAEGKATTKVCIPSPTMCHFRGSRETVSQICQEGYSYTAILRH